MITRAELELNKKVLKEQRAYIPVRGDLLEFISDLFKTIDEMSEALRFYAEEELYERIEDTLANGLTICSSVMENDGGNRARKILERFDGKKEGE